MCALNSSSVNVSMPEAGSLSWVHHGRRLVELVLRGGRYAIRLRDPSAETRMEFEGVSTFPVSHEWVPQGCRWEPKRLRYRLFTILATLARTARRAVLHLTGRSPWPT
jgi:uncharacterized protein (DUF1684 family)